MSRCVFVPGLSTESYAQDIQTSNFACQPSEDNPRQAFFPNIPDFYFDPENAASFSSGSEANLTASTQYRTGVFTIPYELSNCENYSVVGMQYCYRISNYDVNAARMSRIFEFLELSEDELDFNITRTVHVESQANESICSPVSNSTQTGLEQVCCNTTRLNLSDLIQISPGYTFGITPRYNQPLEFAESALEYRIEQFRMFLGIGYPIPVGANFTVEQQQRRNESLFLLRFLLGKSQRVIEWLEQLMNWPHPLITHVMHSGSGHHH